MIDKSYFLYLIENLPSKKLELLLLGLVRVVHTAGEVVLQVGQPHHGVTLQLEKSKQSFFLEGQKSFISMIREIVTSFL